MGKVLKSFWRTERKRRKRVQDRCKNLIEEEKEKKRQYHWDRNKNLSEEEKQKKVEYIRNYLAHKKKFLRFYKVVLKNFRISKNILAFNKRFFKLS